MVVDDNAIIRLGLSEAFEMEPDMESAGTAANANDALALYRKEQPDVVTMDYHMPDGNGVECTQKILQEFPGARIVLLSVYDSEEAIWLAVQAGVKAYLTKAAGEVEDVVEAIREVAAGGTFFPASIQQKLARRNEQLDLTDRELRVLKMVADGKMNKEIADTMGLSVPMVKSHIVSLRKKLDAPDRTKAVVNAYKRGILHLND